VELASADMRLNEDAAGLDIASDKRIIMSRPSWLRPWLRDGPETGV
jgi:hypothetical protein